MLLVKYIRKFLKYFKAKSPNSTLASKDTLYLSKPYFAKLKCATWSLF